ncbi:MAG: riboflavin biosynthesis protein RibF [Planctomycetes bacterium]|nr:riboflavin biosynthesis protein RibF [Planctomycetota bacterium]
MRIIHSLSELEKLHLKNPVITWGIFDGVHKGHRKIINTAVSQAQKTGSSLVILTFDTHPEGIVNAAGPLMLNSLHHRLKLLSEFPVDICAVLPFTKAFAAVTARKFAEDWLIKRIGVKGIVLGENTTFGRDKSGNLKMLSALCRQYVIRLIVCKNCIYKTMPISSTRIRAAVLGGKLDEAAKMLGKKYSLLGRVIHGAGMGKKLGFPTANIEPFNEAIPPDGVYGVRVRLGNNNCKGLLSIGTRPTFTDSKNKGRTVEIYIHNFSHNIYGKEIEAEFMSYIRKQRKFASTGALIRQIKRDADSVW